MGVALILFVYNDILRYSSTKGCLFKTRLSRIALVAFWLPRVKSLSNEIELPGLHCKR